MLRLIAAATAMVLFHGKYGRLCYNIKLRYRPDVSYKAQEVTGRL